MIIADFRHGRDWDQLRTANTHERVESAPTVDEWLDAVCAGRARLAVSDADDWPAGFARQMQAALRAARATALVLVRTNLTARALLEFPELWLAGDLDVEVSFRAVEPLDELLWRDRLPDATGLLVRELVGLVPAEDQPVIVALAVACVRQVYAGVIAAALGATDDGFLETRHALGLPRWERVNAAFLTAHVLVALSRGASEDACAHRAGFADARALRRHVKKHLGRTLGALLAAGGAEVIVAEIAGWLGAR